MEPIQLDPFCESPENLKDEIPKSFQIKNEIDKVEMIKGLKNTITGGKLFIRQFSKSIVRKNLNYYYLFFFLY